MEHGHHACLSCHGLLNTLGPHIWLLLMQEQHKLAGLFKEPEEACNGGSQANGSAAANDSSPAKVAAKPEANGNAAAAQNGSTAGGGGFSFGFKL